VLCAVKWVPKCNSLLPSTQQQLLGERRGEMIRDGVEIAILGPPNAGKSCLLNMLATREAAIVPFGPRGTFWKLSSMSVVSSAFCRVEGVWSDTGPDLVEQEGIQRAIRATVVMTSSQSGLESISTVR
jgi:tRNA modification GTPase